MINALRGMKDILPPDNEIYEYVINTCSEIAKNYGFIYIETPLLEETMLFKRSVGESSDIIGKEMYQFIDKGNHDVCLRPEGTAGVVRSFIQNKMDKAGGVRRFFYHGPMFRYERPQKGRLRQFHQFGVEVFGENNVKEDASIILMIYEIFQALGIKTSIKLNSLGNENCMPSYKEKLVKFLDTQEGLCEDCLRRKNTNPIRVLDCKNENCQEIYLNAPLLINNLCSQCQNDLNDLKSILERFNINYEIDPKLVRGLDYYSKTAFEFISNEIGAQSSIAGGGRYDKLVEYLDGKPTSGIGFAMGIDRLLELVVMPSVEKQGIYLGSLCDEGLDLIFNLAIKKRKTSRVFLDYVSHSLKSHLKQADLKNVLWFACVGEEELKNKTVNLKNLQTKEKVNLSINDFLGKQI